MFVRQIELLSIHNGGFYDSSSFGQRITVDALIVYIETGEMHGRSGSYIFYFCRIKIGNPVNSTEQNMSVVVGTNGSFAELITLQAIIGIIRGKVAFLWVVACYPVVGTES